MTSSKRNTSTPDADPEVEELIALAELQEHYGVTGPQAMALLDQFGNAEAITSADHEELLDVSGVGPMTADSITPKSTRLRWIQELAEPGELIPTYTDAAGYVRHHSERDRHPEREHDTGGGYH